MIEPNWLVIKSDSGLKNKLMMREKVIDTTRHFFKSQGFHEVETPLLVKNPGTEPYLEVFKTELKIQNQTSQPAFLTTSPELLMKKLLAGGLGSIFQICKSFRNDEGIGDLHNSEFTMLEWYRTPGDYLDIMRDCEGLLSSVYDATHNFDQTQTKSARLLSYHGKTYDLTPPFGRVRLPDAFTQYAGVSLNDLLDEIKLPQIAHQKGYGLSMDLTWEEAYSLILTNEIEPHLGQTRPTFLYDYPLAQAALSKPCADDPRFAQRFELYLAGMELANAFSELVDADEQERRCQQDLVERKRLGKTEYDYDREFIAALRQGMPETGGIALGVDRLVMLMADAGSMEEVLFFPQGQMFG